MLCGKQCIIPPKWTFFHVLAHCAKPANDWELIFFLHKPSLPCFQTRLILRYAPIAFQSSVSSSSTRRRWWSVGMQMTWRIFTINSDRQLLLYLLAQAAAPLIIIIIGYHTSSIIYCLQRFLQRLDSHCLIKKTHTQHVVIY